MKIASSMARRLLGTWLVFAITDPLFCYALIKGQGEWGIRIQFEIVLRTTL